MFLENNKNNNIRGDLSDISAKTTTLVGTCVMPHLWVVFVIVTNRGTNVTRERSTTVYMWYNKLECRTE